MNRSFYLMALFLVVVLWINTNSFVTQLLHYSAQPGAEKLVVAERTFLYPFEYDRREDRLAIQMGADTLSQDNLLPKLVEQINRKRAEITKMEQSLKSYNLFIGFFVVVLTGLATLFSSYQQFKRPPAAAQRFAIWVLILTFISTVGNSATLHLTNEIESVHERINQSYQIRESLFKDYADCQENNRDFNILRLQYESYISDL